MIILLLTENLGRWGREEEWERKEGRGKKEEGRGGRKESKGKREEKGGGKGEGGRNEGARWRGGRRREARVKTMERDKRSSRSEGEVRKKKGKTHMRIHTLFARHRVLNPSRAYMFKCI